MPCQIEHDGKARVGAYFDPSVRQENTQSAVLENDSDSKRKIMNYVLPDNSVFIFGCVPLG